MNMNHLLITGADGYLGFNLVKNYLTSSDCRLTLLLNARNNEKAHLKTQRFFARLDAELPGIRRKKDIDFVFADLSDYRFPDVACVSSIDCIIHAAAVTRFDVDHDVARAVNVNGTRRMFEMARCCPRLAKVCLVSSLYATGLKGGEIPESEVEVAEGFANHYEWSKCEAERIVAHEFSQLPWQICRVGLIAADDERGDVGAINALHTSLKLLYRGLLPVIPGESSMPLYLVTADYTSQAIASMIAEGETKQYYNLVQARELMISLDGLIDVAMTSFSQDEQFRRRNILKPLFSDLEGWEILAEAICNMSRGVVRQSTATIRPFARQLYVSKTVCNENALRLMPAYEAPDMVALLSRMCNFLVRRKWAAATESIAAAPL
jgi:thioester reductase-like protein